MCGIAGIFNVDGRPVSMGVLRRMMDAVAHRGPDGEGFWTSSFVGFGHRRLSIIDLSPLGHQPMTTDGNLCHHLQRRDLQLSRTPPGAEAKGHRSVPAATPRSSSSLWERRGPGCVERLHGMFAFAIWDARQKVLFLARDRTA